MEGGGVSGWPTWEAEPEVEFEEIFAFFCGCGQIESFAGSLLFLR